MEKNLKEKAINIKGKEYVLVSDRVIYFNETYPNGMITTELVSEVSSDMVIIKATVMPDVEKSSRYFTGYSQATWGDGYINKTSALENCETSAVGRALAMMGIGVIESIASVDEINKAQTQKPFKTVEEVIKILKYNDYLKFTDDKKNKVKEYYKKKLDVPFISDEEIKQQLS